MAVINTVGYNKFDMAFFAAELDQSNQADENWKCIADTKQTELIKVANITG